jgi:DNA-formamidopyrimidine glycosylase
MPEAAESKLISDNVSRLIKGKKLLLIEIMTEGYKGAKGLEDLNKALPLIVTDVKTRGKFAWMELSNGAAVGYGLGMSGHIRLEPTTEYLVEYNRNRGTKETAETYLKHAHLRIDYEGGHFYYHDVRRFGRWEYLSKSALFKKLSKLGSDLIQEDLSDTTVIKMFRHRNYANICKVLMDQDTIAGIGNYLKAEALYRARAYPLALVKELPDDTLVQIYRAAKDIAIRAYEAGGASLYTYTGIDGDKSEFKDELMVYGKMKDNLGNKVERLSDKESPDGRMTHWVPSVQVIGIPAPKEKLRIKAKLRRAPPPPPDAKK